MSDTSSHSAMTSDQIIVLVFRNTSDCFHTYTVRRPCLIKLAETVMQTDRDTESHLSVWVIGMAIDISMKMPMKP